MPRTQQEDDLTAEEIKDIEEFYKSDDRKTLSVEEFLKELRAA